MRWPFPRHDVTNVVGHVEIFDGRILRGWAWDQRAANSRLCLDVFVRGVFAGTARTGRFRPDLAANGIGDGRHAFTFHVPGFLQAPDLHADEIGVFAANADLPRLARIGPDGATEGGPLDHRARTPEAYFAPLVRLIAAMPMVASGWREADRPSMDRLMISADCRVSPLNLARRGWGWGPGRTSRPAKKHTPALPRGVGGAPQPSAFAAHIAAKYDRSPGNADFWSWYIEDYAIEKGPARAPLSASDMASLAGLGLASRLTSYEWAVDGARRLFIEDCLVDPTQIAALREVPALDRRKAFPLSRFMRTFRARNHLLANMPATRGADRAAITVVIMLYALTDAHYLALLPAASLRDVLDTTQGESLFERVQHELLGCGLPPDRYKAHIRQLGFDLERLTFRGTHYRGHRTGLTPRVDQEKVDVQLIGPFTRRLGLAESCRRIAVALLATGHHVRLVDYDIGVAAAAGPCALPLGSIGPTHLNILHLNAEEVPEAFAYLPDVFTGARNILVPYWELNHPSRVHRLGLELVDEIWAVTSFLAEGFGHCGKPVTRIGMSCDEHGGLSRAMARARIRELGLLSDDAFIFLTTSDALSWMQRKNVLGAIAAFQAAALGPDAVLIVKTRNTSGPLSEAQRRYWREVQARCEGDPTILLFDQDLSAADNQALLAGCDALVSLHRAEGLGLDLLDACARGMPVITTAYSGPMDFCDEAWRVDYDLMPVAPADYAFVEPGHVWAVPLLESAAAALRDVFTNAPERRQRAEAARAKVRAAWSAQRFAERLAALIAERLSAS